MSDPKVLVNLLIDLFTNSVQAEISAYFDDVKYFPDQPVPLVRPGKLQDDPTVYLTNLLIHPGGKEEPDTLYTDQKGVSSPIYEIGGQTWWMRRFRLQFELFFDNLFDRNIARQKAMLIGQIVKIAIEKTPIQGLIDDFGESAAYVQTYKHYMDEGGGEGTYIWRGQFYIEVLTVGERPY